MTKDLNGLFFYLAHYKWLEFKSLCTTFLTVITWKLKGVRLAPGCKFYGMGLLLRHPESEITIGKNCRFRSSFDANLIGISRPCAISTHARGAKILVGQDCGFSGVTIMALMSITIGKDVMIGADSVILDSDWHNIDPLKRRLPITKGKPVEIHDNVFIGYSVTILKGVTIGEDSVIGANSVVSSDIPPNTIAVGNPCKVVAQIKL